MDEDLKKDSELMKKLSESQTLISVSNKEFTLNEMSIGRARKFGIEFIKIVDSVQKETGKEIAAMEVEDVLNEYGDIAFKHLTYLLNWLFSYKNPEYKEVSAEWVEEEISIRIIKEIVIEIARQNQLDWLIPFFQERFQIALETMKG